jgi:hypothetical protein
MIVNALIFIALIVIATSDLKDETSEPKSVS